MLLGNTLARVALVAALAGCAQDGPRFTVNVAPGFTKDGVAISVFGVFRDGRMAPEVWDDLASKFSGVLHADPCAAAIASDLRDSKSPLYSAVDDVTRADGITDALLERFAAAAKGDSILVIVMSGRAAKSKDEAVSQTTTTAGAVRMGPPRGRAGGGRARPNATKESSRDVFEMSASLYSKRTHQSEAMVAMTYTGGTEADAIDRFVAKVAEAFPGASCGGWQADLGVDADTIRTTRAP